MQQGPEQRHWVELRLQPVCTIRRDVSSSLVLDYLEEGKQRQVRSLQVALWETLLITEESCLHFKHRHGICIRGQHRKALRSNLLLNTGQMSTRIPMALNV